MGEMQEKSDAQLLSDYTERGHEAAFGEIVTRYTDLVYSAALRQVESADLAADIAQSVFGDLARKARSVSERLTAEASLAGWLHRSTRYAALNHLRDTRRRQTNERQAMEQLLINSESVPDWELIRPALDEALDSLGDEDRDAVLLRYFKNLDFRGVGFALGMSDDAAQKRVSRAVEHLREFFSKRKVTIGASGLAAIISANAVQAAPVGLAVTISAAALAGTAVSASTIIAATAKTIAMTTLQKNLIAATVAVLAGAGIYEARQTSQLHDQVQMLQQQQAPLAEQIAQLKRERDEVTRQLALLREDNDRLKRNAAELLNLRGEVGVLKAALVEASTRKAKNLAVSAASAHGTQAGAETTPVAVTTDLNPITPINTTFAINQLKDAGNASIEAAGQTALWAVLNLDEQGLDRIRYRDPDAPQLTASEVMQRFESTAKRFADATSLTIAFWSRDGDNQRLVHFRVAWPGNDQPSDRPEGGTLVFHRGETGWFLDQLVVQSPGISNTSN
jgi:RNA polymerase sigma factor (sigma-70 family)